ncbi:MAG TPA: type II CAAX endopeptidase family protein [Rhizomicrobium sp.]|jgi:hypothetical protein
MTDVVAERRPIPASRDGKIRWWDVLIVIVGGNVVGGLLAILLAVATIFFIKRYHYFPISLNHVSKSFPVTMVSLAASDLGILSVLWLVARRRFRPLFSHYFAPIPLGTVGWAAFSGLAIAVVLGGMNELLSRLGLVKFKASDFELALVPHSVAQVFVAVAMTILFVPFLEEMLFRGLILDWLRRVGGPWVAALLSAALFSLVHCEFLFHQGAQGWIYTLNIFLIGAAMAIWVLRTGSLQSSFALHATYNAIGILTAAYLSWPS